MNILLVEDEPAISEAECAYLGGAGYTVTEASTGPAALEAFSAGHFDLVVLDVALPGGLTGLQVCQRLRSSSPVPIIMVTARVQEADELLGLNAGADDYLRKPFNPDVLVARVRALLRRHSHSVLTLGDLTLDPAAMAVTRAGRPVSLTTTQFNILHALAAAAGQVLTRNQLLDRSYDDPAGHDVYDRTIDAHIKAIRAKLEPDPAHPQYIQTVIGRGYRFNPEVSHV